MSGILGGMGMGGGTALIPVLTLLAGVEQHVAQATNLIAFLPMAAISLSVHKKQGNVDLAGAAPVAIAAVLFGVLGGLAASLAPGEALRKLFGAFLVILGLKGLFSLKFTPSK